MGFVTDFVGDVWDGITGKSAAEEAAYASQQAGKTAASGQLQAANIAAGSQREALDYLKEREALPRQFSEGALKGLAGIYGLPGGTGNQQQLIDKAISSPLYQSIMGGQEAGEEAILRSAGATGGLRSGNVQSNLYDYNTQLQNQALLQSYNQQLAGLQGMAGLPSNANAIAQGMSGIGQTLGQGQLGASQAMSQAQVAAAQANQQGSQNMMGNLMGLGGLGNSLYQSGALSGIGSAISSGIGALGGFLGFSDRRLKKNMKKVAEINGHNWYVWDWNVVANKMGLTGKSEGVIADEVIKTDPDCIGMKDGFLIVDYKKLGIFKEVANA